MTEDEIIELAMEFNVKFVTYKDHAFFEKWRDIISTHFSDCYTTEYVKENPACCFVSVECKRPSVDRIDREILRGYYLRWKKAYDRRNGRG